MALGFEGEIVMPLAVSVEGFEVDGGIVLPFAFLVGAGPLLSGKGGHDMSGKVLALRF